jgi:hypothetical protein
MIAFFIIIGILVWVGLGFILLVLWWTKEFDFTGKEVAWTIFISITGGPIVPAILYFIFKARHD